MATTRKSPKTIKQKSPAKTLPGTIRKITPLRKTKTPTSKTVFRSTRTTGTVGAKKSVTPKRSTNIFSRSIIAKTSATRSKKTTPSRITPRRTTPGRVSPGRTTPGRVSPGRTQRKGSPRSLAALKPKTPVKKTSSNITSKLTPRNQFLYIALSICAGLTLFVLILFGFYKLYEYFNPSEQTTTDTIDFMEELDNVEEAKEADNVEEVAEEEKVTEEANEE